MESAAGLTQQRGLDPGSQGYVLAVAADVIEIELPDGRTIRIEPVEDPRPDVPRFTVAMLNSKTGDVIAELDGAVDDGRLIRWSVPPLDPG